MTERKRGRRAVEDRARVMRRDCGLCQACIERGVVTAATQVDHIVPLFKDGSDEDDNKRALCDDCHAEKTRFDLGQRPRVTIGVDGWPV